MGPARRVPRWASNRKTTHMRNRTFFSPDFCNYVLFPVDALQDMYVQAQRRPWSREAGGELYSCSPFDAGLVISSVTGPHADDIRRRGFFNPDHQRLTRERNAKFEEGQHVVGIWHTHPEACPTPSVMDERAACQYLASLEGDRARYLLVTLGNKGSPLGMAVSVVQFASPDFQITQLHESD